MQREISDDVKIGSLVTPFQSVGKFPAGIYNADIAQYVPGTLDLVFQGMIEKIMTIDQRVDTTYTDKEVMDF